MMHNRPLCRDPRQACRATPSQPQPIQRDERLLMAERRRLQGIGDGLHSFLSKAEFFSVIARSHGMGPMTERSEQSLYSVSSSSMASRLWCRASAAAS